MSDYASPQKILSFDFTDKTTFDNVTRSPIEEAAGRAARAPYSPVLVVESNDKIIDGHNGIFKVSVRRRPS
jgi:hypothetical protein